MPFWGRRGHGARAAGEPLLVEPASPPRPDYGTPDEDPVPAPVRSAADLGHAVGEVLRALERTELQPYTVALNFSELFFKGPVIAVHAGGKISVATADRVFQALDADRGRLGEPFGKANELAHLSSRVDRLGVTVTVMVNL